MRAAFNAFDAFVTFDPAGEWAHALAEDAANTCDDQAPAHPSRHFRATFISDLHLGTPGRQADALLDFLRSHPSAYLYLVGGIVDGWQLRRRWY